MTAELTQQVASAADAAALSSDLTCNTHVQIAVANAAVLVCEEQGAAATQPNVNSSQEPTFVKQIIRHWDANAPVLSHAL